MPRCEAVERSFAVTVPWMDGAFEFDFELDAEGEYELGCAAKGVDEFEARELWPVILGSLKGWNVEDGQGRALLPTTDSFLKYVPRVVRLALPRLFFAAALSDGPE